MSFLSQIVLQGVLQFICGVYNIHYYPLFIDDKMGWVFLHVQCFGDERVLAANLGVVELPPAEKRLQFILSIGRQADENDILAIFIGLHHRIQRGHFLLAGLAAYEPAF